MLWYAEYVAVGLENCSECIVQGVVTTSGKRKMEDSEWRGTR